MTKDEDMRCSKCYIATYVGVRYCDDCSGGHKSLCLIIYCNEVCAYAKRYCPMHTAQVVDIFIHERDEDIMNSAKRTLHAVTVYNLHRYENT